MILWHSRFTAHIAEQRFCPRIPTAHPMSPNISSRNGHCRQYLGHILDLFPRPARSPPYFSLAVPPILGISGVYLAALDNDRHAGGSVWPHRSAPGDRGAGEPCQFTAAGRPSRGSDRRRRVAAAFRCGRSGRARTCALSAQQTGAEQRGAEQGQAACPLFGPSPLLNASFREGSVRIAGPFNNRHRGGFRRRSGHCRRSSCICIPCDFVFRSRSIMA
jgi:hypothetical protein